MTPSGRQASDFIHWLDPSIKARQPYDTPYLRSYYDRLYQGLRKAGLPEE